MLRSHTACLIQLGNPTDVSYIPEAHGLVLGSYLGLDNVESTRSYVVVVRDTEGCVYLAWAARHPRRVVDGALVQDTSRLYSTDARQLGDINIVHEVLGWIGLTLEQVQNDLTLQALPAAAWVKPAA